MPSTRCLHCSTIIRYSNETPRTIVQCPQCSAAITIGIQKDEQSVFEKETTTDRQRRSRSAEAPKPIVKEPETTLSIGHLAVFAVMAGALGIGLGLLVRAAKYRW